MSKRKGSLTLLLLVGFFGSIDPVAAEPTPSEREITSGIFRSQNVPGAGIEPGDAPLPGPPSGQTEESDPEHQEAPIEFGELNGAETEELFSEQFGNEVAELSAGLAMALKDLGQVLDLRTETSALINPPGPADRSLVQSSAPLVAQDGELADLTLDTEANAFKPVNPYVATEIPKNVEEPVSVGAESGFTIGLEGVEPNHGPGRIASLEGTTDDAVIYPNVDEDTDLVVMPIPNGIETFTQVRTSNSPEESEYRIGLPSGAHLEADGHGGAVGLAPDGEPLLAISPPTGFDADGDSVPVDLQVEGNSIKLNFPHRDEGFSYPILIDPVYELYETFDFFNYSGTPFQGWLTYKSTGANFTQGLTCPTTMVINDPCGGSGEGLFTNAAPGTSFAANSDARWYFTPPGTTTHILDAWLDSWRFRKGSTSGNQPHAYYGIATGYLWNSLVQVTTGWGGSGLHLSGGTSARQLAAGLSSTTNSSLPSGWQNFRYNRLANFTVRMGDGEVPSINSYGTYPADDGWINASESLSRAIIAADFGLGVSWFEASYKRPGQPEVIFDGADQDCVGGYQDPCEAWAGYNVDYSDLNLLGAVTFNVKAFDALGKPSSAYSWSAHSDPVNPRLSLHGPLSQKNGETVAGETLRLKVVGSDDQTENGVGRSGLNKLEIKLDGVTQSSPIASCAGSSCVRTLEWNLDSSTLAPGAHEVEVTAEDIAGNKVNKSLTINVVDARIVWPRSGDISAKRFGLAAQSRDDSFDEITFEYRRDTTSPTWTAIPPNRVNRPDGNAISSWPVEIVDDETEQLSWNAWGTSGLTTNGPLQVRAVFRNTSTNGTYTSPATDVTLNSDAIGSNNQSTEMGPGQFDLITGNMSLMFDDVSIGAYGSDLVYGRTYASRAASENSNGPLGPGWTVSTPVDEARADYLRIEERSGGVLALILVDNTEVFFRKVGDDFRPDLGFESLDLQRRPALRFELEDHFGNRTTFEKIGTHYVPIEITQSGGALTSSANYAVSSGQAKIQRLLGPEAPGVNCPSNGQSVGCRSLRMEYATNTTSTGNASGQLGDFAGRLKTIYFEAGDPADGNLKSIAVAKYEYGSDGRLRAFWDPRISPVVKEFYDYDGQGLLTSLAPAGEAPYVFEYESTPGDSTPGRLDSMSRTPNGGDEVVTAVQYEVPLTGEDAPHDMSPDDVAEWGQTDIPEDATAVFPPTSGPEEAPIESAAIYYMNRNGQGVNLATPNGIETTEFNEFGQERRSLSAQNRLAALAAPDSVARSYELDSRTVYSDDGLEIPETLGPAQFVRLKNGSVVEARHRVVTTYDEGAPDVFHLPTTIEEGAYVISTSQFTDVRTVRNGYADGGWHLRAPTSEVSDPTGLNLRTTTKYDPGTGFIAETTRPKASGNAHTSVRLYYTAGAHPSDPFCGSSPVNAGNLCVTKPKVQPSGAHPDALATYYLYNIWGAVRSNVELNFEGDSRTSSSTFDAAGRETAIGSTSSDGEDTPTVLSDYDSAGNVVTMTSQMPGADPLILEREYDDLGRLISYTDAKGVESTFVYDEQDRVVFETDGKTTRAMTYDDTTGALTSTIDSRLGTFEVGYDEAGRPISETLPNGIQTQFGYNSTGEVTELSHTQTLGSNEGYVLASDSRVPSVFGQWTTAEERFEDGVSTREWEYVYDEAGRLTESTNIDLGGECVRRGYEYDANSNRTGKTITEAAPNGSCTPLSGGDETNYLYDGADRLSNTGVTYDGFGRTTALPASLAGGTALTLEYFGNDRVRSMTQGTDSVNFELDPNSRVLTRDSTGDPLETSHYSGDSDSPSWTEIDSDTWNRNLGTITGAVTASEFVNGGNVLTEFSLTNLHGDVVWIADDTVGTAGGSLAQEFDEFGVPIDGSTDQRFGWLGVHERATELPSGAMSMGSRVYMPTLGRFLQVDPVDGGSANDYDYVFQDPVNVTDLDGNCPVCAGAALLAGRAAIFAIKNVGKKTAPRVKAAVKKVRKTMPKKGVKYTAKDVRKFIRVVAKWAGDKIYKAYEKHCWVNKLLRPGSFLNSGKRFRFGVQPGNGRFSVRAAGKTVENIMGIKHVYLYRTAKGAPTPNNPC